VSKSTTSALGDSPHRRRGGGLWTKDEVWNKKFGSYSVDEQLKKRSHSTCWSQHIVNFAAAATPAVASVTEKQLLLEMTLAWESCDQLQPVLLSQDAVVWVVLLTIGCQS